jgi:XTP/dITP diphosphohydrolase
MSVKTLIFATGNPNKVREVSHVLAPDYQIKSLADIGAPLDLPETRGTLEGNALQKAEYVLEHFQLDCFSEDTGLFIEALNGHPGVDAAIYAGPEKNAQANMDLVLQQLGDQPNRKAYFRSVIALLMEGESHLFIGELHGTIRTEPRGTGGFGYDPIFQPDGYQHTLAEMEATEKYRISHRTKAVRQLVDFLKSRLSS